MAKAGSSLGRNEAIAHRRQPLPTGTVTFLFSDIEGSTRLVQDLGPARYRDVLEEHHRVLREAFGRHGGTERGTQGDSFLVIFRDATSAISAAIDAQRGLAATAWPDGGTIRVRMGLHTGLGERGGDDYVGVDINRAARIAAVAHGGQIVVSAATRALVEGSSATEVEFRDLGEYRLRDLTRPERLHQVVVAGLPTEFPALRSVVTADSHLPPRLSSFIGRNDERTAVARLIAANRLVTLTGPGGTGKTSLATEVARDAAPGFGDGAWFAALDACLDPADVASTIAVALELRETGGELARDRLAAFVAGRSMLLVLDNFEHVLAAGPLVSDLLRAAPGLHVIATSRAPLHLAAEQEFAVSPLAVPGPSASLGALESIDSVHLFVERARRVRPEFVLDASNADAVAGICVRLDGLPLAIELVAARVGLLSVVAIRDRLARRLELPGPVLRDIPERQRTLSGTIAWSHDLLDAPGRTLLARLSVFVGGWRLDEAESVCGPATELGIDVLDGLAELVDQSLVHAVPSGDGARFHLLETVRTFASTKLLELDDAADIQRRHGEAYLALAEAAAQKLPGRDQVEWLARLTIELDNLRAAIRWSIEVRDTEVALRLAAALWRYWQLAGLIGEGLQAADALLEAGAGEGPTAVRMRALEAVGGLHYWAGDLGRAAEMYERELALARDLDDVGAEADALVNLGTSIAQFADQTRASALLDEATRLYTGRGDRRGVARVAALKGFAVMMAGDAASARAVMTEAAAELHALDDTFFEATAVSMITLANVLLGDIRAACAMWRRATDISYRLGDIASTIFLLDGVGMLAAEVGAVGEAAFIRGAFDGLCRRRALRPPRPLDELAGRSGHVQRLVEALGPAQYEEAFNRGRELSLDDAVEYAIDLTRTIEAGLGPASES